MAICRKCRAYFERRGMNHLDCPECGFYQKSSTGRMRLKLDAAGQRIRADLDKQVTVYTSTECSQEFLKTLIPL